MDEDLNSLVVRLNFLNFTIDANQFALLVDVLSTIASPLPQQGDMTAHRRWHGSLRSLPGSLTCGFEQVPCTTS